MSKQGISNATFSGMSRKLSVLYEDGGKPKGKKKKLEILVC